MTTIKATAPLTATLTWDGTQERLVSLADELSITHLGCELDSLDAGDALGALIQIALMMDSNEFVTADGDSLLSISIEGGGDGFKWEGLDD